VRFRFACACLLGCGGELASVGSGDAGTHPAPDATSDVSAADAGASAEEPSCPQLGPKPLCPPGTRFLCHDEDPPACGDTWSCSQTSGSFLSCEPYGDAQSLCDCPKGTRVAWNGTCPAGSVARCVLQTKWCASECCLSPADLPTDGGTCVALDAGTD
jgi:hypothetical protein